MSLDRLKDNLLRFLEATLGRRIVMMGTYRATVVSQAGDGSLELLLDDAQLRGSGMSGVTMHHGTPGVTAELVEGARCTVAFAGGDPDKPYVLSYERGTTSVERVELDAETKVTIGDQEGDVNAAARESDPVISGYLILDATIPTLYWAPDVGGAPGPYTPVVTFVGLPPPGTAGTALSGRITGGSGKVDIED